jgi:hypothetical protein
MKRKFTKEHPPKLQEPGAGINPLEQSLAKLGLELRGALVSRADADIQFAEERDKILALEQKCDRALVNEPVLVRPLFAIEDSSRFWSVWMTLDHLRIVNSGVTGIIDSLARGIVPGGTVSTADVKPSPDLKPEVVAQFKASCDAFLSTTQSITNLKTTAKFRHPWFGEMDASGWHTLVGVHLRMHRKQVELILEGL